MQSRSSKDLFKIYPFVDDCFIIGYYLFLLELSEERLAPFYKLYLKFNALSILSSVLSRNLAMAQQFFSFSPFN